MKKVIVAAMALFGLLCILSMRAHAASLQAEVPAIPYVGTQYGSKLGLEIGTSEPLVGLFSAGGAEELRLSANLSFPTAASELGEAAAGLSIGKPLVGGEAIEAHLGLNVILISGAPKGVEAFFGFQSSAVVSWFVGLLTPTTAAKVPAQ